MSLRRSAVLLTIVLSATPWPASAQPPAPIEIRGPAHTLDHDFALIRSARALEDGRLLIIDWLEQALFVVDFAAGSKLQIGRSGNGPDEYRLPAHLRAMAGDSTLLVDIGSQRSIVVGPDLQFHRTVRTDAHGAPYTMEPAAIDRAGRFYFAIPGWAAGPGRHTGDSVDVARFDPVTSRIEPLGRLLASQRPPDRQPLRRPRWPFIIFSPRDAWAVTADGRVAFIRSGDYHVEWLEPSGALVRGRAVSTERIPVTDRMRHDYVRESRETGVISGRGPDGGLGAIPKEMLTPQAIAQGVEDNDFADVLPPFDASAVFLSPSGNLWVNRYTAPGTPATYDVFDGRGEHSRIVTFPPGRRLIAINARTLYAVWEDDTGLQYIERFANPVG